MEVNPFFLIFYLYNVITKKCLGRVRTYKVKYSTDYMVHIISKELEIDISHFIASNDSQIICIYCLLKFVTLKKQC